MTQDEAYSSIVKQFVARFHSLERIREEELKEFVYQYDYSSYDFVDIKYTYNLDTNILIMELRYYPQNKNEEAILIGSHTFSYFVTSEMYLSQKEERQSMFHNE